MERIKFGTYPATLQAADWQRILIALGSMLDEYTRLGLEGLAEDAESTLNRLRPQVTTNYVKCEVCGNEWDTISPCAPCNYDRRFN